MEEPNVKNQFRQGIEQVAEETASTLYTFGSAEFDALVAELIARKSTRRPNEEQPISRPPCYCLHRPHSGHLRRLPF